MACIQQRSRYPRPLKATHSFTGPVGTSSAGQTPAVAGGSGHPLCSSLPTSPSGSGNRRVINSPERRSPVASTLSKDSATCVPNPRRSNSMGSLSDPDVCWTTPTIKSDPEELCSSDTDTEVVQGFSHKRSSSCSSAEHMTQATTMKSEQSTSTAVHTCMSIEGLNQEITLVLEGEPSMMNHHPDGHIAPVRDLLGRLSTGGTPPHHQTHPSSQSPSPYPPPLTASHHHTSTDHQDTITGNQTTSVVSRDSPGTPDYLHHHPSSPKPSFAREPPDGAERCVCKQETRLYSADFIQKGPDRSKANIIFKGTAFAPLLSTAALPVSGQC